MIANRTLELDDYLAMGRRHLKSLLILPLVGVVVSILVSFAFSPKYTSVSLVGVERQTVTLLPNAPFIQVTHMVAPSLRERMMALQQRVLSRAQLQTLIGSLGLARDGKNMDRVIADIQNNVVIDEVVPLGTPPPPEGGTPKNNSTNLEKTDPSAFSISVTADSRRNAQQLCRGITSMLLTENLQTREQAAEGTAEFISHQLADAKSNLDEKEKNVAAFKSLYLGQLPSDLDSNLRILADLKSQLDADTQLLNRTQQYKSYEDALLAQQLAAWKSSEVFHTSQTIEQRLATLQTQLLALQTQYTEDHPEVIKMKQDIAALEAKQKEIGAVANKEDSKADVDIKEPLEIRQLRDQIYQNEAIIAQATEEQKELQEKIHKYESRLTLSPKVEEEYKQLTRDDDTAHQIYNSLLASKSQSDIQADLERRQQAEQLRLLDDASWPVSPSFPDWRKFALYGLGAGLAFGFGLAMLSEFRDKAIRDERDVLAGLELPMLTNIPWMAPVAVGERGGLRGRFKALLSPR